MRTRNGLGLVVVLALTGCTSAGPEPDEPSATPTPSSPSATPSDEPTDEPSEEPAALDWKPVPGPVEDQVTTSGPWSLALVDGGGTVRLDGPEPETFEAPSGYAFSEALIDGQYAVVVAEHEQASRPNVVSVRDLESGETTEADTPPGVGGAWALGSGILATTVQRGRDYCVASVDLVADRPSDGPCVPPRHGISTLTISPAGTAAMTFDDGRPSCRTLNRVEGQEFTPLAGVTECAGWEAVVTETAAIWGEVPNERRIESATYFLDAGNGTVDLGPGTTGSLTWCGDAAYVVRDPQRSSDPARLLRVVPDAGGTEVVYETEATGRAFLSAPRCGATDLTITAYTGQGDEQVTASLS